MLNRRGKFFSNAMKLLDMITIIAAFFAAYCLRINFHFFYKFDIVPSAEVVGEVFSFGEYLPVLGLWIVIWITMLLWNGIYRSFRTRYFLEIVWVIVKAAFFVTLCFGSISFIVKIHFISRVFFVLFMSISTMFLILQKGVIYYIHRHSLKRGHNIRSLLIVGTGPRAERFIRMLKNNPQWGFKILGLIDDDRDRVGKQFFGLNVLGTLKDITCILMDNVVDEVIFIVPRSWLDKIQESIALCELLGVKVNVAADLFNLISTRTHQADLNGFPMLVFENTFGREGQLFFKRLIDLIVSGFGIVVLSPFLLLISFLVKITSSGPVFFKQKRVTLNGRIFILYKFRSMYKDANERLEEVKHLNEMDGPVFKAKNDPRITPLGKFLRKTSIDELPQLFNVFVGQMSLVGPRPPIPREVEAYDLWQMRRLSVRSGISCLWQIRGRSTIPFEKWMEYDLEYIDNWSLWLDFEILVRTVPVVLFGIGAE